MQLLPRPFHFFSRTLRLIKIIDQVKDQMTSYSRQTLNNKLPKPIMRIMLYALYAIYQYIIWCSINLSFRKSHANIIKYNTLLLSLLFCTIEAHGQLQQLSWDEYVQSIYEEVQENEGNLDEISSQLYELEKLHQNPLDINTATQKDLASLPFLDNEEIDQILLYIYRHERIDSWGELLLIPGLHTESIRVLPLFCTISEHTDKRQTRQKGVKQSFDTRIDIPLYSRKGYISDGNDPPAYAGNKLYHRMRYTIDTKRVKALIYAEKDAGERFYDFYGGYIEAKNLGIVDHLVIGDYRIGCGEGLVIGRYRVSKSSTNTQSPQGILPQQGTTETNILRGAAITMSHHDFEASVFGSYSALDATLSKTGNSVQTIINTGLHRTESEREKKHNLYETLIGCHLGWNRNIEKKYLNIGITGTWRHTSITLDPRPKKTRSTIYRDIYPKGKDCGVFGINYEWSSYRWAFSGETATSLSGWGTIGRLSYKASKRFETSAVGRYYSDRYFSAHSTAFSENSRCQNETGVLIRFIARPWDIVIMEGYADFFYFHWPRYRMSASDSGQDIMGQITVEPNTIHSFIIRYNLIRKATNDIMNESHRIKLQYTYSPNNIIQLQTTITTRYLFINDYSQTRHFGCGAMQHLRLHVLNDRLLPSLSFGYFNTPVSQNAIYMYEPTMWNTSQYNKYYGHGIRFALLMRYTGTLSRNKTTHKRQWMAEMKYGMTHYFDRITISTGLQSIPSSYQQDISLQIRLQL